MSEINAHLTGAKKKVGKKKKKVMPRPQSRIKRMNSLLKKKWRGEKTKQTGRSIRNGCGSDRNKIPALFLIARECSVCTV